MIGIPVTPEIPPVGEGVKHGHNPGHHLPVVRIGPHEAKELVQPQHFPGRPQAYGAKALQQPQFPAARIAIVYELQALKFTEQGSIEIGRIFLPQMLRFSNRVRDRLEPTPK